MATSSTTEHLGPTELDGGKVLWTVAFSPNGQYLVSGDEDGIRVWRVEDGTQIARIQGLQIGTVAVSNDSKWIAAGGDYGDVYLWDAQTHERVISFRDSRQIEGVDFSPDATHLVVASDSGKATILQVPSGKLAKTLEHGDCVLAAKCSPQGDYIATATHEGPIRFYDNDGQLLAEINTTIIPYYNKGLVWFNDHLLVVSSGEITQIESYTRTTSSWPVPDATVKATCIALPKHGKFLAYATQRTVTFWDTSTHAQLGLIERPTDTRSIAISPDDRLIAIGGTDDKVVLESLTGINASVGEQGQDEQPFASKGHDGNHRDSISLEDLSAADLFSRPTLREPDLKIDDAILDLWMHDQLTNAEASLTAAISTSRPTNHHLLVCRSLVRARFGDWDAALTDAEKAFELQPSVLGYVAKSRALVGKQERDKGYRACDIASVPYPSHVCFLLLVKAVIVFMAGDHLDGISRMDDIIAMVPVDPTYHIVQAYMHFLVGNSRVERRDYERAVESFQRARAGMRDETNRSLLIISLISGWKFDRLSSMVRLSLCVALYGMDHTGDAIECLEQMTGALGGDTNFECKQTEWIVERVSERLVLLGDTAADAERNEEAVNHYTNALSLEPPSLQDILVKRAKALMATGAWKRALDDADRMIALDPSSPWGYQIKHAALHQAGEYVSAINAFEVMLSKFADSPDPDIQQHGDRYISPQSTRATIRNIVQRTISRSPRVVIDTTTGRLHDRSQLASSFESLPVFHELISSTTTRIDYVRIKREVRQYFRYAMFSHKWDNNEPLFQQVMGRAVYELEQSATHNKLQMFCRIVRDAGIQWAWSDTCCIEKSDHIVLQEALVAMFKWYQGAVLTIVFLRGVRSWSQLGALVRSIWNKRGWTLQEYIASKVVHFYTEDWTLYLGLELTNHKGSPEVISEMEQATGVSAEELKAIRPGLSSIREKLRLASPRETTHPEDAAYSLLGIFSVSGLSAIYGEGNASLGRLLAYLLAGSGDVSILAWTGVSGSFNSALPAYITVFGGPATSHLPLPIPDVEMARFIDTSPPFDLDVALSLYDHLRGLPAPWFAANRMKLPCIALVLPPLCFHRSGSDWVYRADTPTFGTVEIRTRHNLSQMTTLYLIHPWLDFLLEPEDVHGHAVVDDHAALPSPDRDDEEIPDDDIDDDIQLAPQPAFTHQPLQMDDETRARRFVARLRQPFGALLVTPTGTGRRASPDYKRVAADSLITVRIQESVSLACVLDNVQTLDVL